MSFLYNLTHNTNPHKQLSFMNRKENIDSLKTINTHPLIDSGRERASAFTSNGSITLEAAIVIPIFFFAMLCLAYLLEMMAIQTTMRNALYSVGKNVAQQAYVQKVVTPHQLEQQIIANIGTDKLERSIIAGGAAGIDCSESVSNWSTGVMDLCVQYNVEIPVLMFRAMPISCKEILRVKGWSGYGSGTEGASKKDMVYVTETGIVYHRDVYCTYLDMSIRTVRAAEIEELRNQSGGKYYACESCEGDEVSSKELYITDYGTRYHTSLDCKKIQRNVYVISMDEAYGLGGCSKCVN